MHLKYQEKNKISKAINNITAIITDLEEGIKQVHADKVAKKQKLDEQKKQWEKIEQDTNTEIKSLEDIAATGFNLQQNIANLLKGK